MLQVLKMLFRKIAAVRYQRGIGRALALHLRGEVRSDGLEAASVATQLHIDWRARDIHPWDRPLLSPAQRAAAFVEQALADTEAAVYRLFDAFPQVDTIALRVLDRESEHVILAGAVARPLASVQDRSLSVGMRLRYLGITYYSAGAQFEALESYESAVVDARPLPVFPRTDPLPNAIYRRDVKSS